ncbi:MAG: signal peptidase II, partial [Syntrophothermus sp.]
MKRPLILGLFILFTDQILKWYFQTWFDGKRWLISDNWGFTYITNPGIWLKSDISNSTMLIIQIYALIVWVYL